MCLHSKIALRLQYEGFELAVFAVKTISTKASNWQFGLLKLGRTRFTHDGNWLYSRWELTLLAKGKGGGDDGGSVGLCLRLGCSFVKLV